MLTRSALALLLLAPAALCTVALAGDSKPGKPRLELRATPRMAFSPVSVLLTGELVGGADSEDFHCPELEWDWDDGGKSVQESDCTPFAAGTAIDRRFTAEHSYKQAGTYNAKLTMRHVNRPLATATVKITVRPGHGDRTTVGSDE